MKLIMDSILETHQMVSNLIHQPSILESLEKAAFECVKALENGNKIFFMGNGGSAAESQHLAAELVGMFLKSRKALPAIALTTDTSILTAIGNDFGYEEVFSRQLEALAKKGDVAIYFSTSGTSKNVVHAMETAFDMGLVNIAFTGENPRDMEHFAHRSIKIPSSRTPQIQEGHLILGHILCEYIEQSLYGKRENLSTV
jgi:D-sedoheptulose 7-phosphate isomerase